MRMMTTLAVLLVGAALLIPGCSQQSNSLQSQGDLGTTTNPSTRGGSLGSSQAAILSATLYLNITDPGYQTVNIHRVTVPWDEATVTWNSFGSGYVGVTSASFPANVWGEQSCDVTALVQSWMDGTYPNNGMLLEQGPTQITWYSSSETADVNLRPRLEICFGPGDCTTIQRGTNGNVYDTRIWELLPTTNYGSDEFLGTGLVNAYEKQTLIKFDLPETPETGCTHTIGYWKTHAGFGPQADVVTPLLPIWLGNSGGAKSLQVTTNAMAVEVLAMKTYGSPSNGITKLYAQLLGAKLSIADGASDDDVAATIAAADAFLASYNWQDWNSLSSALKRNVLGWQTTLDNYNNGLIGPGHCDEVVTQ